MKKIAVLTSLAFVMSSANLFAQASSAEYCRQGCWDSFCLNANQVANNYNRMVAKCNDDVGDVAKGVAKDYLHDHGDPTVVPDTTDTGWLNDLAKAMASKTANQVIDMVADEIARQNCLDEARCYLDERLDYYGAIYDNCI